MPGKFDPNEIHVITLRTVGGEAAGASALAPKVGPLGLSAKKIGDDIMRETQLYKGIKVTLKLIVQNRQAKIEIVPSASTLLIKALNEPVRDRKKVKDILHDGNLDLEQVVTVARTLRLNSCAKLFKGTVCEILGTCQSMGCTVDGEDAHDIIEKIQQGEIEVEE